MTTYLTPAPLDPRLTESVLWRRCAALVLDCIGISLFTWASWLFIAVFGVFTLGLGWLAFHLIPFLPFAYYTLLIGGTGATPGQRLMGLAMRQDDSLAPPTLAQALVWTLLFYVSIALAGVPFLLALLNPRKRAAHDILAGLLIIRTVEIPY